MKKSALALILAVLMAVGLLTIGAAADDGVPCEGGASCNHVAAIDDTHYDSLAAAVTAAQNGDTITLLKSTEGSGVQVIGSSERTLTIDLNNCVYTIINPTVGSPDTETNGFQLLKGSTVTIKNGTIKPGTDAAKILFQNYCNLTLDNVTVDCTGSECQYVSSNNCGNVVIRDSKLIAAEGQAAFDVYYWPSNGYKEGVTVTVEGDSVITGRIEYGSDGTDAGKEDIAEKAKLNITGGTFTGSLSTYELGNNEASINVTGGTFKTADGTEWDMREYVQPGMKQDENGKVVINEETAIATVDGSVGYTTLKAALAAAKDGQTVTLLNDYDATNEGTITLKSNKSVTLDLGENTLTISRLDLVQGWLTVENGNVKCTGQAFNVYAAPDAQEKLYTKLVIKKDVTINAAYGICLFPEPNSNAGYSSSIEVYGNIANGGIFVSGNLGNDATTAEAMVDSGKIPTVTIYDGAVVNNGNEGQGIAMNGLANVTVDGGTITGSEAIGVKRGTLTVNDGMFTSNGEYVDPAEANNNGTENTGATISITGTYNYAGAISVTLNGGTFSSENAPAVYLGHSKKNDALVPFTNGVNLNIKGGTFVSPAGAAPVYVAIKIEDDADSYTKKVVSNGSFSSSVAEYVTDDLKFELNNNGTYSYYKTAEEALANAEPGAVIKGIGDQAAVNVYSLKVVYGNGQADFSVKVTDGTKYILPSVSKPGYIFMGWKCSDGDTHQAGETVTITKNMTFTAIWANMPDITPGTPDDDDEPVVPDFPFTDVREGQWFYEAVKYVYDEGIMNGMDRYIFDPNGSLTRAMVWTMLARHEGVDTEGGANWYAKAQEWAVEAGVSDGTDPMGNITREQLVTMLWRLNGSETVTGSLTGFTDYDKVSDWAGNAMLWATVNGIIEGDEANALNPTAGCTRAQAAAMIMRFCAYHEADSFGTVV